MLDTHIDDPPVAETHVAFQCLSDFAGTIILSLLKLESRPRFDKRIKCILQYWASSVPSTRRSIRFGESTSDQWPMINRTNLGVTQLRFAPINLFDNTCKPS
jgi:hypothetical protein